MNKSSRKSTRVEIDLATELCGISFKNPVTVASGTFGSSGEYRDYVDLGRLGAIITKTVTVKPRKGNPMPRIWETPAGMLNSIGLQNKGIEDFIENKIPYFRKIKTHLIVNIAGESVEEFALLAKRLDREKTVRALELNISCPNVKRGLEFCARPELTEEVVRVVKSETSLPIFTKLSPEARGLLEIAEAAVRAGSDGLSLINTLRGMAVDIEKRRPRLATIFGGLSGPAIRPIALRYLYEVKKHFSVPVIAMGGIVNAEDALEFIICGADLIAVGTANFVNPRATVEIIEGIRDFIAKEGLTSIRDLRGTLRIQQSESDVGSSIPAG